jgi:hypothetical protein
MDHRRALLAALLVLPLAAHAHHSWRAVYDGGEEVTLDARIASEVYRNPHLTVRIEIPDDSGELEEWTLEWRGSRRRDDVDSTRYDLHPGDQVVIDGRIARFPGSKKIQMFALTRPADGMHIEARRGRSDGGR